MPLDVPTSVPSLPVLPEEASSRLMRMLESVRLETSDAESEVVTTATRTACAQCESTAPWGNSSWCPECGYYPKLGRAMTPSELENTQEQAPVRSLQWLVWVSLGAGFLLSVTIALRVLFPDEADRGPFGRLEFMAGCTLLLAGQIWAYLVASHGKDGIPLSSIFFEPFQLWAPVLRQLPQTRHAFYCGAWGLLAMSLAIFGTGMDFDGMFSGLRPQKKKRNMMQAIVQAISAADKKSAFSSFEEEESQDGLLNVNAGIASSSKTPSPGDLESAMTSFSGTAGISADTGTGAVSQSDAQTDLSASAAQIAASFNAAPSDLMKSSLLEPESLQKKVPLSASGQERRDRGTYVIFGYMTNSAGEIRSLLLAEARSGRARYVGKLPLDEMTEEECAVIQKQLDQIRSARSALRIPYHARWVHPLLLAQVAHVGWTPEGQLRESYLISLDDSQLVAHRSRHADQSSHP